MYGGGGRRASWRTVHRKHERDRDFLRELREAVDVKVLVMRLERYQESKDAPDWKIVALERAIARLKGEAPPARRLL